MILPCYKHFWAPEAGWKSQLVQFNYTFEILWIRDPGVQTGSETLVKSTYHKSIWIRKISKKYQLSSYQWYHMYIIGKMDDFSTFSQWRRKGMMFKNCIYQLFYCKPCFDNSHDRTLLWSCLCKIMFYPFHQRNWFVTCVNSRAILNDLICLS